MTPPIIFHRKELLSATLDLGSTTIELADYATTGLRAVAIGPSGIGKTNTGLLIAEQLGRQGWVSVLVDPEGELAEIYRPIVNSPKTLELQLESRETPIIVVPARNAQEFLPFGTVILSAADRLREPLFVMLDESQLFSTSSRTKGATLEASTLVTDMVQRGRKRRLDLFLSAHKLTGSLNRNVFAIKNLTLIGRQEDPAQWSTLAPLFRGTGITYADAAALAPGEFFCFSRRGAEKITMKMAEALAKVAPQARTVQPRLPATFSQWDKAIRAIPTERLRALTGEVIALLGTVAGLTAQQLAAGTRALKDELATRTA